jgi:Leucine-rich repeat (LRR) protein
MPSSNKRGLVEAERRIVEAKRTGATALNLSDLDLEALPESVCRLAHLRFLYLNNNRLTQLPESIGRLARLQELALAGNRLTHLPATIGGCARLRKLYLDDNRLVRLPESVGRLARLESLCLSHNRLTQLPKRIGQLAWLNRLYLNSNQLPRLPGNIGQLAQLEELYLDRNHLTQLPTSIRQLAQLRKLYLHGNEALNIPEEELGPTRREMREKKGSRKPPREILDYYFRARGLAKNPTDEAKLILVGRGKAENTSLRKTLITGKSERGKDNRPGIAVTPWPLKLGSANINVHMTKICFVVAYFGKWPIWFPAFLHSCKSNPTINWIFFTDCGSPAHPPNVVFYDMTLSQMRELIKTKISKKAMLEGRGYKVCDYKSAFGVLFDDYLNDFDFWGHCDIDIIWGDIRKYTTEEILDKYDIFSTRKGAISGHFSLFRNTPGINQLFRRSPEFAEVMRQPKCRGFDEEGMTRLVAKLARAGSIRVHWPKFLQNYADPKTSSPSKLPQYMNKYRWKKGKLFDCTGELAAEILYLHSMTWKKTLTGCEFSYGDDPEEFYISYSKISMQPISLKRVHSRA